MAAAIGLLAVAVVGGARVRGRALGLTNADDERKDDGR
jgi:hypothetical protein